MASSSPEGGQHEDGDGGRRGVLLEQATGARSRPAGHDGVDDEQVGPAALGPGQAVAPVGGLLDDEFLLAQEMGDDVPRRRVVVDEEHLGCHALRSPVFGRDLGENKGGQPDLGLDLGERRSLGENRPGPVDRSSFRSRRAWNCMERSSVSMVRWRSMRRTPSSMSRKAAGRPKFSSTLSFLQAGNAGFRNPAALAHGRTGPRRTLPILAGEAGQAIPYPGEEPGDFPGGGAVAQRGLPLTAAGEKGPRDPFGRSGREPRAALLRL